MTVIPDSFASLKFGVARKGMNDIMASGLASPGRVRI